MLRLTLRSLRAHASRLLLSSLAIVLGVGFVTGTLIFSDGLTAATEQRAGLLDRFVDVELTRDFDVPAGEAGAPDVDGEVLPATLVDAVRQVDGVAAAEGTFSWYGVGLLGPDNQSIPGLNNLVTVPADPQLAGLPLAAGRLPQRPGEAVLDARTADRRDITIGDQVQAAVTDRQPQPYQVVGLVDVAGTGVDSGGALLGLVDADARQLTGRTDLDRVLVVAAPGVGQAELAERLRSAAGGYVATRTGEQLRAAALDFSVGNGEQFTRLLLAFAAIAVFVAAFVIANTFTILLAQRTRETALLRLVGATRAQLFRAGVVEAAAVGLIGAVWGLLLGVVAAAGLRQLYAELGSGMPSGTVVSPRTVVVALVCGVGVTVGAALLPAWRGTAVPPVAALTDAALTVARPVNRLRLGAGLLLIVVGVLGLVAAGRLEDLLVVVAGGILAFVGLVLASPLIVPAVTRLLGRLTGWVAGPTARLAVANAVRNPRRAAATAMALVIGIGLVTSFSVGAHSVKRAVEREVDARIGAAFLVESDLDPVPPELVNRLRDLPELGVVLGGAEVYGAPGGFDVAAGHPDLLAKAKLAVADGDVRDFGPGRVIVNEATGFAVGDRFRLEPVPVDSVEPVDSADPVDPAGPAGSADSVGGAVGQARDVVVAAVLADPSGGDQPATGRVLAVEEDVTAVYPDIDTWLVQLDPAAGVGAEAAREAVESIVVSYPFVTFVDRAAYAEARTGTVDTVLRFVLALLALAILISLLGLANTLTLSVVERTRENALLRAVGLTRGQLRRMLATEAVLTAVSGTACGIAIGVAGAASALAVLNHAEDDIFRLDLPWTQLGVVVAVAAVAALVASVLPARRALRQPVVESLAAD
ncbi:putative ABC transport system permease protein [Micromonospora sp. Llam0]|uniref:ABC transporter permease n=1 Tax=Micromonospora sp. Llam0 TaxID=2485143 RepID=UPI000F48D673|nr:FtsX-like permease family protein [Micromonospora sp. Llam0]ROO62517.1 putative ABC transport system permease protein [Micromonospora sp. Llam0]